MPTNKILVIDDEPEVSKVLEKMLNKAGYEVTTVQSGKQALEKIINEPYSLVLCDVMMPEMDGLTVLSEIKKINTLLPVVMMSGLGTHDRVIQSLEKGAVDFLGKPFNFLQVNRIIQKFLRPDHYSPPAASGEPRPNGGGREYASSFTHLMREGYIGLLDMIDKMIGLKNPYLKDHVRNVDEYSTKLAQALKLPEGIVEVIHCAAILHDIGKVGVNDLILLKPAKLNEDEWKHMKEHPRIGRSIIEPLRFFRAEEPLILHHHEHFNGKGYPNGLTKDAIPLGARIIAVADAYDAMTSTRPYRQAMDSNTAKNIIRENSGTQFDPKLAEVFLNIVN